MRDLPFLKVTAGNLDKYPVISGSVLKIPQYFLRILIKGAYNTYATIFLFGLRGQEGMSLFCALLCASFRVSIGYPLAIKRSRRSFA